MSRITIALVWPLLTLGCAPAEQAAGFEEGVAVQRTAVQNRLILLAANTLDLDVLDDDVALDSRAASNIVSQRPFTTVEELDTVSYVGDSALGKLLDYALEHFERPYTDEEAEGMLSVANTSSAPVLRSLGLGVSADIVLAERPLESFDQLRGVWGIDAEDLDALLAHHLSRFTCVPGTVQSTTGLTYDSLDEAVVDTPPGGELRLCEGDYSLSVTSERLVHLAGAGSELTSLTVSGSAVRFDNMSIEGLALYSEREVTFVQVDAVDLDVALDGANLKLYGTPTNPSRLSDSRVTDMHVLVYSTAIVDEVDFRTAYLESYTSSLEVIGGSFIENATLSVQSEDSGTTLVSGTVFESNIMAIDIRWNSGTLVLDGARFGLGGTDNLQDIVLGTGVITWLHGDTDLTCSRLRCD